jgi:uncharacterized protein YqgC (DUF456 family)
VLLSISLAILVSIVAICCLVATVLGLPGNWLMVGLAALMSWGISPQQFPHFPIWSVFVLAGIAVVGEIIEFVAGAAGVGKMGGARRSAALAVVGSLVGAIAGLFVGVPIPIIGSVVASLLLAGVGAWGGAVLGERWAGKSWDGSIQIGNAAFWGRLFGTVGKSFCGVAMVVFILFHVWW